MRILDTACSVADVAGPPTPIKLGENAIFRLPGGVVARITRVGQQDAADRELRIARWLRDNGIPAVEPADTTEDLVIVEGRAVTFWKELSPHRNGLPAEIARALRRLHTLPPPAFLNQVSPFVRLTERIAAARTLTDDDREWLSTHLNELRTAWNELPPGMPWCPIHGDAWDGNVVTTEAGTTLFLDLERASVGPPEWDLVHTAIKLTSFGWISRDEWDDFAGAYGSDVTTWAGFELLRDIREMRMTCMAVQTAAENPSYAPQAQHRVGCLRGRLGIRPWRGWEPIP
ncbi:phosphotransferase enzyme family protein [Nocardia abscessus]|uniref:phosphotransferase enzyme family protein n=1 Tax=Nocardia abscessus TaxID=120957 RepID=UPI002455B535|nr:aminoglycoside phosphotransferase family protein [Nocardia abscessus]